MSLSGEGWLPGHPLAHAAWSITWTGAHAHKPTDAEMRWSEAPVSTDWSGDDSGGGTLRETPSVSFRPQRDEPRPCGSNPCGRPLPRDHDARDGSHVRRRSPQGRWTGTCASAPAREALDSLPQRHRACARRVPRRRLADTRRRTGPENQRRLSDRRLPTTSRIGRLDAWAPGAVMAADHDGVARLLSSEHRVPIGADPAAPLVVRPAPHPATGAFPAARPARPVCSVSAR